MRSDEAEMLNFFTHAKDEAVAAVEENPTDVTALTRWGGALLEIARFQNGRESLATIKQANSQCPSLSFMG